MLRMIFTTLLLGCCGVCGTAFAQAAGSGQAQQLPIVQITAGMHLIKAEVARTFEQRQIGLMHRPSLPQGEGMLFVFEEANPQCFWMKNTLIPLSIAFVADDGTVLNLADMQPLSERSKCSAKPVRYALEMNQGWFAKRGIKPGSKLRGGPWPP
ncbi:uncharacterized membrane protein (UPF0127 family) [Paucibacter oligotrophus]|uniref:Uncharacterized membrane protein (UPF0127 family) n=1 Tax=Roseateles oligotrophus TaxID=1769250 RepID=A0A840L0E7_9BURK|nr:DUF192 domain-containing protein [Roseateles oligotrophus]MBB4841894.1 uncharacterized membrane protein (UPF0127 family) [Roseateles oligotrophus]